MNPEMRALNNLGRAYLGMARSQMRRGEAVSPMLVLSSEAVLAVVSIAQDVLKGEAEKEIFARMIKRRVEQDRITAIGSMFDSSVLNVPGGREEEVVRLRAAGMTSRDVAAAGIGRYHEAVVFSIDLRSGESSQLILEYRQTPQGFKFEPVREEVVTSSEGRMYFFGE